MPQTSDPITTSETTESNRPAKRFRRSDVAGAVTEFHAACGLPIQATPSIEISDSLAKLRVALLEEECGEFASAIQARDLVAIADALADVVYVAYGTAITYGIDLDLVLSEVHRANMTKLDHNGKPVKRDDGKILKSKQYTPPDVKAMLQLQSPLVPPSQLG